VSEAVRFPPRVLSSERDTRDQKESGGGRNYEQCNPQFIISSVSIVETSDSGLITRMNHGRIFRDVIEEGIKIYIEKICNSA